MPVRVRLGVVKLFHETYLSSNFILWVQLERKGEGERNGNDADAATANNSKMNNEWSFHYYYWIWFDLIRAFISVTKVKSFHSIASVLPTISLWRTKRLKSDSELTLFFLLLRHNVRTPSIASHHNQKPLPTSRIAPNKQTTSFIDFHFRIGNEGNIICRRRYAEPTAKRKMKKVLPFAVSRQWHRLAVGAIITFINLVLNRFSI